LIYTNASVLIEIVDLYLFFWGAKHKHSCRHSSGKTLRN